MTLSRLKGIPVGLTLLLFGLVPGAGRAQTKGEGFSFPGDAAGKRLEMLLRPGGRLAESLVRTSPTPRVTPGLVEQPETLLPGLPLTPPRLELAGAKATKPPHPPEPPLSRPVGAAATPALPSGELVRWPSPRVDQVPPLPFLAQPQRDRASLGDPTMEVTLAAALRQVLLSRAVVPFAPVNLPDPFEPRRAVELRDPPPEGSTLPKLTFPRLPGR